MSAHTPGPWEAGDNFVYALNADGVNRFFCAVQPGWIAKGIQNRTPDSELAANARLIAAAPELLEALRSLVPQSERVQGPDLQTLEMAKAAIFKATGAAA